jgi:hypothetical protein
MRNQAPTLAPGQPASDVTVHIVLNDFGDLGRAYVETDEAEADEASTHPIRVVAFNTVEGWARDVTRRLPVPCSIARAANSAPSEKPRRGF